jgi:hypothetical protein
MKVCARPEGSKPTHQPGLIFYGPPPHPAIKRPLVLANARSQANNFGWVALDLHSD